MAAPSNEPSGRDPPTTSERLTQLAAALFLASLALPALAVVQAPLLWGSPSSSSDEIMYGAQCLLLGIFVWPAWLANPLVWFAALCSRLADGKPERQVLAAWLAACAFFAAILAPFLVRWDGMFRLRFVHVGYYVWVASIGCFAVAAVMRSHDLSKRDAIV